jgi:hypothetical protein
VATGVGIRRGRVQETGRFSGADGSVATGFKSPLGAEPGDTLDDLFPGSGAVTRAWAAFTDPSRMATGDASRPTPETKK